MRIVKTAEERKNEILDAADELFGHKGFDGTSTNDILEKVGIARGTLYHHFRSKGEIMASLIERYSDRLLSAAREAAADGSVPVVERIVRVVMALNLSGGSGKEIMEHIHKPQHAHMHRQIQAIIFNDLPPILADLIREGIEQGIFRTPFPHESMEMVVAYANTVFDHEAMALTDEERLRRIRAFAFNIERLVGAETGSLLSVIQRMFGGGHGGGQA